jgi:hypothetical protein
MHVLGLTVSTSFRINWTTKRKHTTEFFSGSDVTGPHGVISRPFAVATRSEWNTVGKHFEKKNRASPPVNRRLITTCMIRAPRCPSPYRRLLQQPDTWADKWFNLILCRRVPGRLWRISRGAAASDSLSARRRFYFSWLCGVLPLDDAVACWRLPLLLNVPRCGYHRLGGYTFVLKITNFFPQHIHPPRRLKPSATWLRTMAWPNVLLSGGKLIAMLQFPFQVTLSCWPIVRFVCDVFIRFCRGGCEPVHAVQCCKRICGSVVYFRRESTACQTKAAQTRHLPNWANCQRTAVDVQFNIRAA